MGGHSLRARERDKLEAQVPGFPCLCICACLKRHWHIETDLCQHCLEESQANPKAHGEP